MNRAATIPRNSASLGARKSGGPGLALVALAFLLAPVPARAWNAAGHMLTAQIARERLSPGARAEADRLIAVLAAESPKIDTFVAASTWMDLLRGEDWKLFNTWHYVDFPVNGDGLPMVPPARPDNVLSVIADAKTTLASPKAGDFLRALALRFLIHLVGDIHQPLHSVERFTQAIPTGDQGGNLFLVAMPEKNLHWYWDNAAEWLPNLDAEKKETWTAAIPDLAAKLTAELPPEAFPERTEKDPNAWARESYALALSTTYEGIVPNTVPTEAYVARAQATCKKRLALAGYRLADLLEDAFAARAAAVASAPAMP